MIVSPRSTQQGFLLIAVVVVLAVLAATAMMLSSSTSADSALLDNHTEDVALDYLVESGVEHAQWLLSEDGSCAGYANLPNTPFGIGSYSATVTPTSGSPVSVTTVGALADGTTRQRTIEGLRLHDMSAPVTLVLRPGAEGKDTFIEGENGHLDHNKGDDKDLRISSEIDKEDRALVHFDLSAVPSTARIRTATLELYLHALQFSDVVNAHRMQRDWAESAVTWNSYDGAGSWTAPGGDYAAAVAGSFAADSTGPKSMDVSAVVEDWVDGTQPNYGLVLLSNPAPGGRPNEFYSSDEGNALGPKLTVSYFCECGTVCTGSAADNTVILSTDNAAVLGGLSFTDIDLVNYDPLADFASLELEGALTSLSRDIDAVHVFDNGNILLSTKDDATLGGLSFEGADLVEYDPAKDTATMYFDGSLHFKTANEDISSVHVLGNGNLVLSTENEATLGSVTFGNRDLVEYNPSTTEASLYLDGDSTTLSQAISAVHILENGNILMAAKGNATLGGLSFTPADLVEYDQSNDTATLYFAGSSAFGDPAEKIVSVHIDGDGGPGATSAGDYLDEFNAAAFDGDDGSYGWSSDWQELGESNGPGSGRVRVVASSTRCVNGNCLRIGGEEVSINGRGVSRQADLSGATTAELSFTIADSGSEGSVSIEISGNGGSSWTTLATFSMGSGVPSTPTPQSFDISAYAAADTEIRFVGAGSLNNTAYLYIDNVRIDINGGAEAAGGGGAPGGTYTEAYQEWTASQSDQWQVTSLSAFGVPANAVVEVAVINDETGAQRWGGVRAVGSSLDRRLQLHEAESGGVDAVVMHVQANGSSEIEHYSDNTGDVFFALLGYWSDGVYVERFDSFSAGSSGSWQDRDLDTYGVGADQVAEIVIANTASSSERVGGVRENGSSAGDRFIEIHEAESGGIDTATMLVNTGSAASASIEVYAESNGDIDFYLIGYWTTPPGAFVEANGGDFDPSSPSEDWSDWSLGAEGVPADSIAHITVMNGETNREREIGVRGKGSSNDRLIELQESESGGYDTVSWHVPVDANSTVEFYDEDASENHRFRVLGWWVLP